MKCSTCSNRAVYYRANESRYLCKNCFNENFEKKVKKTIRQNRLIENNDCVAIALSGGKDSSNLAYLLTNFFGKNKSIKIFAITIDEGIKGYRDKSIKSAKKLCKQLGIKHYVVSFDKGFKKTMDKLARREKHLCTYCGVFRRYLLNKAARELKATKLATAHNLDDEAQSIVMNMLKGDTVRMVRIGPKPMLLTHKKFVTRIKPMIGVLERESALYNLLNKIPSHPAHCPYAATDRLRGYTRKFLNELEEKSPGIKYSLVQNTYKLVPIISKGIAKTEIGVCEKCGEPSSQKICKACELLSLQKSF